MLINLALLSIGLILLFYSSDWLVDSASSVAAMLSIKPIVIGLTIVAFGTSTPEFLVSLFASYSGESGISIGNILGSNVMNIALVIGASVIVSPLKIVAKGRVNREMLFMIATSVIFWIMCFDGHICRLNGLFLAALLISFLIYSYLTSNNGIENPEAYDGKDKNTAKNLLMILSGIAGLCIGANLVVNNAVKIATYFNISKTFIGISLIAFGTSLPELATSVLAAKKGESEIAIGNVIGSNLFNICMVMGFVGILNPIQVESGLNKFEFPFMILISILFYLFLNFNKELNRKHGVFFIIAFLIYLYTSWYLSSN